MAFVSDTPTASAYVQGKVRASNRTLFLVGVLGLVLCAVAAFLGSRYLANFFAGPQRISKETLLSVENISTLPTYWVTVESDLTLDTGWQLYTRRTRGGVTTSETVTASYAALLLDERALLTKLYGAAVNEEQTTFTGALIDIPNDVRTQVIVDLEAETPELTGIFLPYMMDTGDFRTNGYIGLAIGGVVALLSLIALLLVFQRTASVHSHPIIRSLARYGDAAQITEQINREMAAPHTPIQKMHFLQNWVLNEQKMQAIRYTDLMWLYQKTTQRRVNGVPAGKSFEAVMVDRHGKEMSVAGSQANVTMMLGEVFRRAPWAIGGYQPEIAKMWRNNRQGFIAAVDARRLGNAPQTDPAQPTQS